MKMNLMRPTLWAAIFFSGMIALLSSCEKPEESLGIDLQPEEDIFGVTGTDSITVHAVTQKEDSLRSDGVSPAMAGAYMDPIFGFAKASHNTEIRLTTTNPNFVGDGTVDDLVIDSLILRLYFSAPTADLTTGLVPRPVYAGTGPQYFQVFELDENLHPDSAYYATREAAIIPEDLVAEGENLIAPNYRDSVFVNGAMSAAHLRIPLKHELGERIIEAGAEDGLTAEEFQDLVKGLQITVDEDAPGVDLNNTGIVYFQTLSGASSITMYYRNLATEDTLLYNFSIRGSTGKYNYFEHDYSQAANSLYRQVETRTPDESYSDLYIQAMSGTKIKVDFPFLNQFRDSTDLAVARAELILPVRAGEEVLNPLIPPSGLFIFGLDEEGRAFLLDDRPISGGFNGALYDPEKKEYRFSIPRYIQQVLSGERESYGLEIVTEKASYSANRVVINGPEYPDPQNPEDNMKLLITFTKY